MNAKLKEVIESIEPVFCSATSYYYYELPDKVSLFLESDEYTIDVVLHKGELHTRIYVWEDEYLLNDNEAMYLYNYLDKLLDYQIELTKDYYEQEKYNQL